MSFGLVNRFLMVLAATGIFISGLLTYTHSAGKSIPCGVQEGCDLLARLPESKWAGVPISAFGLLAYAALFVLAILRSSGSVQRIETATKAGIMISVVGTLVSMFLVHTLINVLRINCPWCFGSALVMMLTLVGHGVLNSFTATESKPGPLTTALPAALMVLSLGGVGMMASSLEGPKRTVVTLSDAETSLQSIVPKEAYFKGPADAPVTVVEFADFYCPSCRDKGAYLPQLVQQFPNKIRVAYRHFPLFQKQGHEYSLPAAVGAEIAAEHGKYWEYVESVFGPQFETVSGVDIFVELLAQLGVEREIAKKEIGNADGSAFEAVVQSFATAERIGLKMTPSFVVFAKGQAPVVTSQAGLESLLAEGPVAELVASKE